MPRILIADSDASLAQLYGMCLRRGGYEVYFASNALECWAQLHEVRPAALLLEWELPWGGGDGVVSRLREDWLGQGIFVVLTTTTDLSMDYFASSRLPVNTCLRKPFRLSVLKAALQDARHGQTSVRPGQTVRISRGPLAGVTGIVRQAHKEGSWLLEIAVGERGVYCVISPESLEVLAANGWSPEESPHGQFNVECS